MINSWCLLYEELNGTMNKTYPITGNNMTNDNRVTPQESDEYDPIITIGSGNTASPTFVNFDLTDSINNVSIDTSNFNLDVDGLENDVIYSGDTLGSSGYETVTSGYETLNISFPDDSPLSQNFLADNDDAVAHHFEMPPTPSIEKSNPQKYEEDKSIKALQNYISTTYNSHYTSERNDVQTLDLIESVGDAESFCRSNAIKYLSRYDKKGQAKRDILKALHYSLLLYYFSGQLHETPTRGYETF